MVDFKFRINPKINFCKFLSKFSIETEAVSMERRSKRLAELKVHQTVKKEPTKLAVHFKGVRLSRSDFKKLLLLYNISENEQDENGSTNENSENEVQKSRSPSTQAEMFPEIASEDSQMPCNAPEMVSEEYPQMGSSSAVTPMAPSFSFSLSRRQSMYEESSENAIEEQEAQNSRSPSTQAALSSEMITEDHQMPSNAPEMVSKEYSQMGSNSAVTPVVPSLSFSMSRRQLMYEDSSENAIEEQQAQTQRSTSTQATTHPEADPQLQDIATLTPQVTPLRSCLSTPGRSTPRSANRRVGFKDSKTVRTFRNTPKGYMVLGTKEIYMN